MPREPYILINQLSYAIPNTLVQFHRLDLAFRCQRYGIIGDNGVGKTTLLKLIKGLLRPQSGSVQNQGEVLYCPQHYIPDRPTETIAEVLNVAEKCQALKRIQNGRFTGVDYEIIGDDWGLEDQIQQLLQNFDEKDLVLDRPFLSLSGGQQTKCLLFKALLSKADFILWDEPTNNLDSASRQKLQDWVRQTQQGLILVSHDRALLNHVDEIIEITSQRVHRFGGNYDFFEEQKAIQEASLQQDLIEAKRQIKKTQLKLQQTREKHEQRSKKGKNLRRAGKLDKLTANSMRGHSEKTRSRNNTQGEKMLQQSQENLNHAQSQLEVKESIHANLEATFVPNGKTVFEIENISFSYPGKNLLLHNFSLKMIGPERIAIKGKNGCGKTTLIKLILGELQASQGDIKIGIPAIAYLDQRVSFLNEEQTLIDNMQHWNSDLSTFDAYSALASFNFRNRACEKEIKNLSGGERIRAGLAIRLLSKTPPQLIILDEPTNHLDIRSIEALENALNAYQGAMIVISHDAHFLKNIQTQREVNLDEKI